MPEYNATENPSVRNNTINNPRNNTIRPASNSSVNMFAELIKKPLELFIPSANAKPSVYAGKQLTELPSNIKVLSSDNDGNFIYRAKDFSRYMEKTNEEPINVKDDLSNIQGKKGVIYFDNYHIDLWDETNLVGNGSSAFDYINNRNKPAVFWEAK